jgi:Fic family protein
MISLDGTPYFLDDVTGQEVGKRIAALRERVDLLRSQGRLSDQTLRNYFGEKRFELIAESNALEGSTLSAGETELAVMKGITISGHDPRFTKDARSLSRAIDSLAGVARDDRPVDLVLLRQLQGMILGDEPGAGEFRRVAVEISGAKHKPPAPQQAQDQMLQWQQWSRDNAAADSIIRSAVLHAWLVHIHPFVDGNGRTARAVQTLELIRSGYPAIIIKKKDRSRYLDALASSDEGSLSLLLDLVLDRLEDAIRDLVRAAERAQGYSEVAQRIRKAQERRLSTWTIAVEQLRFLVQQRLAEAVESLPSATTGTTPEAELDLDDFLELCAGHPVGKSWSFRVSVSVPGLKPISLLAWAGYRSRRLEPVYRSQQQFPSLFWSSKNPEKFPPWVLAQASAPLGEELTLLESGDRWAVLQHSGKVAEYTPNELAVALASTLISQLG